MIMEESIPQHHVGSHYGDLTRYLAPMINLSCEKFDSAHRIIVKRNLSSTQSRFYEQLVVERVSFRSASQNEYDLFLMTRLLQEMRRDMTRSHRKSVDKSLNEANVFHNQHPVFSGTLKECLAAKCCQHLSANEKYRLVSLIIAAFATSIEKDFENMLGDSMIEQQLFKVADQFSQQTNNINQLFSQLTNTMSLETRFSRQVAWVHPGENWSARMATLIASLATRTTHIISV